MAVPLELLDCFEILGVKPGARPGEIRSAFRKLALSYHPDVAGVHAAEKFESIAAAYILLKTASPRQITEAIKQREKAPKKNRSGGPFRWGWKVNRQEHSESSNCAGNTEKAKGEANSRRVRDLLLEKIIVETELSVARILEKSQRGNFRKNTSAITKRLLSTHPGVRLLALGALGKLPLDREVFVALLEMFRLWTPDDDAMEHIVLLEFSEEQKNAAASVLCGRFSRLSENSALVFLRWISSLRERNSFYRRMLGHSSAKVLSSVLGKWNGATPPDDLTLIRLLKREEDVVLIPLLRLIKQGGAPAWASARLTVLGEKHSSPAVRVWARSIVRA